MEGLPLPGSPERRPMLRAPGVWSSGRVHGLVRGLGLGIVGEGGVGADACLDILPALKGGDS